MKVFVHSGQRLTCKAWLFAWTLLLTPGIGFASQEAPNATSVTSETPAPESAAQPQLESQSRPGVDKLVKDLRWRNIGPANMMGRIAAIDALNTDYRTVLIGSASGGVFKSDNAGITWTPIFDRYGSGSIGDVAFFQEDPSIIWVGTGEAANRNSSGWGDGIYKSTDGGRSFKNMGLEETHHVAEIAVHPTDPDIVYAAAVGHLWGYSGERGLFKTVDGGDTWTKLTNGLPDDGKTGCTEIIMDPNDPQTLFAGFYHRIRSPATFQSGGFGGGLFKSTDGGKTWRKLTKGLPTGDTGMIDISIHRNNPQIMVANVETDESLPDDLSVPGPGIYRSDDGGESWKYLYRSTTRPFYHGQVEIDPVDPNRIYVVSRSFAYSRDGGKTWKEGKPWISTGGDDHDLWICPTDSNIAYTATDQGAYLTLDGKTTLAFNNMAIGQYYAIGVDMRHPYWVIGGLQDNGIWMGPSNSREVNGILNMHNMYLGNGDGFHSQIDPTDWRTLYFVNHVGFAARYNAETEEYQFITPTPETIVNFKEYYDPDYDESPTRYTIEPGEHWFFGENAERPLLPAQFRFNWSAPLVLSPQNPRTLYFGSNHLFKSVDRGETWRIISPDLTTNDPKLRNPSRQGGLTNSVTGGENHCTIVTIAESPLDPSVVWVGTDDGNIQVTRSGGNSWVNVRPNIKGIPAKIWVSRVVPSAHDAATAYITLDNHRLDDMAPYVYKTTDFGQSWTYLGNGLPSGSVYVLREDQKNSNLLFIGTEFAVFVSIDGGQQWTRLMNNMPTVAMHDLVIHPRESDLVAGTHGRSIWILDDMSALQQLTDEVLDRDVHLFQSRVATNWIRVDQGRKQTAFLFRGENPPRGALIHYYLKQPAKEIRLIVEDAAGRNQISVRATTKAGINRATWNLTFPPNESDIQQLKATLAATAARLKQQLHSPDEQNRLATLMDELDQVNGMNRVNRVRGKFVKEFGAQALGRQSFGKKLKPKSAPAGTYRIILDVDGHQQVGSLRVQDDPLKIKNRRSE